MSGTHAPAAAAGRDVPRLPSTNSLPRAVGLDPSLTSTGLSDGSSTAVVKHRANVRGLDRLRLITGHVLDYVESSAARLVVIEGFIPGKAQAGVHERGGLWWMLVDALDCEGRRIASVKPQAVKQYATGKGNAGKDEVIVAATRRFDWFAGGNDEADALWLAAIGAEILGRPLVDMPARNRDACAKVEWYGGA